MHAYSYYRYYHTSKVLIGCNSQVHCCCQYGCNIMGILQQLVQRCTSHFDYYKRPRDLHSLLDLLPDETNIDLQLIAM